MRFSDVENLRNKMSRNIYTVRIYTDAITYLSYTQYTQMKLYCSEAYIQLCSVILLVYTQVDSLHSQILDNKPTHFVSFRSLCDAWAYL